MKNKISLALMAVYTALVCVSYTLNGGSLDKTNLLVNTVFFLVVGIISIVVTRKCYNPTYGMMEELRKTSKDLKQMKQEQPGFLREHYVTQGYSFDNEILNERYQDFLFDMNHVRTKGYNPFCTLEEYFDEELVDETIKKSMVSQLPGIMTGLGILGTFIGLSIGLSDFKIDTAAEMSKSISPLMNGIKVAFHTSIYGIILSMFFTFATRHIMRQTKDELNRFVNQFNREVLGISQNQYYNYMLQLQKNHQSQKKALDDIAVTMKDVVQENYQCLNTVLTDFVEVASTNQKKAIQSIVNKFVKEMQSALGTEFKQLGTALSETILVQEETTRRFSQALSDMISIQEETTQRFSKTLSDTSLIQEETTRRLSLTSEKAEGIVNKMGNIDKNINDIIASYSSFLEKVDILQDNINSKVDQFSKHVSMHENIVDKNAIYLDGIAKHYVEYKKENSNLLNSMQDYTQQLKKSLSAVELINVEVHRKIADVCDQKVNLIGNTAEQVVEKIETVVSKVDGVTEEFNKDINSSLIDTFKIFDENLSDITGQLNTTILEMKTTVNSLVDSEMEENRVAKEEKLTFDKVDTEENSIQINTEEELAGRSNLPQPVAD